MASTGWEEVLVKAFSTFGLRRPRSATPAQSAHRLDITLCSDDDVDDDDDDDSKLSARQACRVCLIVLGMGPRHGLPHMGQLESMQAMPHHLLKCPPPVNASKN